MPVPLYQVDAFTDTAFCGNPAAVCFLDRTAPAEWMQHVAAEMNLSETAFVVPRGNGDYDLRWFTPTVEVDLCGHATLASAHLLWETERIAPDTEVRFHTRSGLLTATRSGDQITLDFPATVPTPADAPDGLAGALGLQPVRVLQSRFDYLVEVEDEATVRSLAPDCPCARRDRRRARDYGDGTGLEWDRLRLTLFRPGGGCGRGSGDGLGALLPRALLGRPTRPQPALRVPGLSTRRRAPRRGARRPCATPWSSLDRLPRPPPRWT